MGITFVHIIDSRGKLVGNQPVSALHHNVLGHYGRYLGSENKIGEAQCSSIAQVKPNTSLFMSLFGAIGLALAQGAQRCAGAGTSEYVSCTSQFTDVNLVCFFPAALQN